MATSPALLSRDLRAITGELSPCVFVWGVMSFDGASYDPGAQSQDPVTGGIVAGMGNPVVMLNRDRFPAGVYPREDDECSVIYGGETIALRVATINVGVANLTVILKTSAES